MLSVLLGTSTYFTVRRLLLEDRRDSAIAQVVGDARLLSAALRSPGTNPNDVLASLRPPARSTPLLHRDGDWFAASLQVRPEDLPAELVEVVVERGSAARQTVLVDGRPVLVAGVPLGPAGDYFEVFALTDVAETLSTLLRVLLVAGAVTTTGGAVVGGWIGARVLSPLREVTAVARAIADGELASRLDESLDRDLSDLTASFNQMADILAVRIDREARFASDVAHELRTPLTTLLTSLAVLEGRDHELSGESREALRLLARDVKRLGQTTEDLIEIAKLDAGADAADLELVPMALLIPSILNRLRRPDISVNVDRASSETLVSVDVRRMERILANLISNAEIHAGGVLGIFVESHEGSARLIVEDEGPGIPAAEHDRIFERFARGTRYRAGGIAGSGLGLSLAAEHTRLQGGDIWVENRAEGGTRFIVQLKTEVL